MESIMNYLATVDIGALVTVWGVRIITALLIYVIGKWIAKKITSVVRKLMEGRDVDPTLVNFLSNIV